MADITTQYKLGLSVVGEALAGRKIKGVMDAVSGVKVQQALGQTVKQFSQLQSSISGGALNAKELTKQYQELNKQRLGVKELTALQKALTAELTATTAAVAVLGREKERQARTAQASLREQTRLQRHAAVGGLGPAVLGAQMGALPGMLQRGGQGATGLGASAALAGGRLGAQPQFAGFGFGPMARAPGMFLPPGARPPDLTAGGGGGGGGGGAAAAAGMARFLPPGARRFMGPAGLALSAIAAGKSVFGAGVRQIPAHLQLLEQQQQLAANMDPSALAGGGALSNRPRPATMGPVQALPGGLGMTTGFQPGGPSPRQEFFARQQDELNSKMRRIERGGAAFGFDAQRMGGVAAGLLQRGGGTFNNLSAGSVFNAAAAERMGIGGNITGALRFAERRGGFGSEGGTQQSMLRDFFALSSEMGFEGLGEIVPNLQSIIGLIEDFRTTGISLSKESLETSSRDTASMFGPIMGSNIAMGTMRASRQAGTQGPRDVMDMFMLRQQFEAMGVNASQGVSAGQYETALDRMANLDKEGFDTGGLLDMLMKAGGGGASGRLLARSVLNARGIEVGGDTFTLGMRKRAGERLTKEEEKRLQTAGAGAGFEREDIRGDPNFIEKLVFRSMELAQKGDFKAGGRPPLERAAEIRTRQMTEMAENVLTSSQNFRDAVDQTKNTWVDSVQPFVEDIAAAFATILGVPLGSGHRRR